MTRSAGRPAAFRTLFVLVACLAASCGGGSDRQAGAGNAVPESEPPTQESWNSALTLSRAGKPQAVIRYGHMEQYDSRRMAYFDGGVSVDFFDAEGRHTSVLTSDRGEYNSATEEVRAIGNVVVVSDTGVTLRTAFLRWDPRVEKILSDSAVTVTTQDADTLFGTGFESASDLSHWMIRKPTGSTARRVDVGKAESGFRRAPAADSSASAPEAGKEP
ncbi:MAG: LPS export ABC transporter periplasmic protein LptC [bacterium]|nr:LPS export ABC transporter periplasmic protein LptC [bacterium]